MTLSSSRQCWLSALVVGLAGIIWFFLLGYRDLFTPDEGRYAEIAREMLVSGDWTTPRLNGFKYFEKPPMQYWGTAISIDIFGETNAAGRVWCAGLGFIGALWVGFVGKRLYGSNAGLVAFLVLISSFLYTIQGHVNTLDMGVSVFLAIAIGALVLAQQERDSSGQGRNWMLLGWAALAGATLSKGLIGLVLPGGAIFLYTLWQRDWALWRNLHIVKGMLLFLLLVVPWFILVSSANPEFPQFFFIHEHFDRFTSGVHERTKSWWYFFMVFAVGTLPWIVSITGALIKPVFAWRGGAGEFDASRFLWVYAVFIFFFFSISNSKLPAYILPMFPALALLVGEKIASRRSFLVDGIVASLLAIGLFIYALIIDNFATEKTPLEYHLQFRPWVIGAALLMSTAAISAIVIKGKNMTVAAIFSLCSLLAFQMINWGFQSYGEIRSSKVMAEALKPYSDKGLKIYSVYRYDQAIPYYLGRTITLVGYKGEFEFGINQEPELWVPGGDEFTSIWKDAEQAVAILPGLLYDNLLEQEIPMKIIYQDPRHIAVARR